MRSLKVDTRWHGHHGIARFSAEVLPRLNLPWEKLDLRFRPASLLDVLEPGRMTLSPRDVVFSPGFNVGVTRATQLCTVHDLIPLRNGGLRGLAQKAYFEHVLRPVVRDSGLVFTVSETSQAEILDWLNLPDVRVINVGNGVDPIFTPAEAVQERFGFLCVSNLKNHKNLPVVLRALSIMKTLTCTFVVPPKDVQAVKSLAYSLGVLDRTIVFTDLDDKALLGLYRTSKALVLPSYWEGFGLPAAESLASGTPVIYFAGCNSVSEIVGNRGIAIESAEDETEWAAALAFLEAEEYCAISDELDDTRFSWEHVAEKISTALATVVT